MVRLGKSNKDHNMYVMVGTFALVFMVYLWLGPRLIKKPAGTPPRSGSNEEAKQVARVQSGMPPQPIPIRASGRSRPTMDIGGF